MSIQPAVFFFKKFVNDTKISNFQTQILNKKKSIQPTNALSEPISIDCLPIARDGGEAGWLAQSQHLEGFCDIS